MIVPLRYIIIRFTIIQCVVKGGSHELHTLLTLKEISKCVEVTYYSAITMDL